MLYNEGYLYLFGGLTEKYENKNNLYRFSLINNQWELINTKGKTPCERCYHQMSMINEDFMVVYGGARFNGNNVEEIYNDILPLINFENRQCGFRGTKTVMKEGGVIKSDFCRHPIKPLDTETKKLLFNFANKYDLLTYKWGK